MANALINNKVATSVKLAAILIFASFFSVSSLFAADAFRWSLGKATLVLTEDARALLVDADGEPIAQPGQAFRLGYSDMEQRKESFFELIND